MTRLETQFAATDALPSREAVLENQSIPIDRDLGEKIEDLIRQAMSLFEKTGECRGVVQTISTGDFEDVYSGEGENEPETPIGDIFPLASQLALFAVTAGGKVSEKIDRLFSASDFALAAMLDSVASCAVESAADLLELGYLEETARIKNVAGSSVSLRYSPGYCGWHVSGQKKLFQRLRPQEIGITLRPSYLMEPLKSISGVFIIGPKEINQFTDTYTFCVECRDRTCQYREPRILSK
jgi:hypothetical protein